MLKLVLELKITIQFFLYMIFQVIKSHRKKKLMVENYFSSYLRHFKTQKADSILIMYSCIPEKIKNYYVLVD